jgi:sulfur-oxidizing protein SoxA
MKKTIYMILIVCLSSFAYSASYNKQAEKDRKALVKYFKTKFGSEKQMLNAFPYYEADEVKNKLKHNVKAKDLSKGVYSFAKASKANYDDIMEFPPYEFALEEGEKLFKTDLKGKSYKKCLGGVGVKHKYPKFDKKTKQVTTLEMAINKCRTKKGLKPYKLAKGKLASLSAYIAYKTRGKKINVKITSKDAAKAYENGKKFFYSKRGYLGLSCASCHVQGAGQRVRAEYLSPLLGQVTHFPVYRLKWQGLGTMHRRLKGCQKNQGTVPEKHGSVAFNELEYFMTYMSNGLKFDGPDVRK